ncbi:mitogen-activated protein kinase kinase kinase NPK1-like isoform X2 [Asparagus officinalis]|uniref:mitogen-activated protein kinase kinase kinase NPK1-like isoform X2 n=1 Tax=Asparagus officinalis TaxID=4686 RepID=UPI00098E044C|nr:mitogen-activated protein kinase kinase kinase NPK1-like isoform X2 [Asparagus officinalis]
MSDFLGSVRRSLVFRPYPNNPDDASSSGRITDKIGSCLRKSRVGIGLGFGFLPKLSSPPPPQPIVEDDAPPIRWRKGELIGCGAFGHVYMGMNLDSGELLAVKQVLIGVNSASKEKAQAHIRELEEEVKLLKNLSHRNIVRYLGTAREEGTLNILLEFVPGGSISSLLGKFGSFPEAVIRMYTKQLLQGLEYLHLNKIIHRDIKGANILVDNKGCIKLADFGASKQVAKLATMNAAKSMKGTPYWMAPEVIVQSGHSFSADIWSVGCTVIEMATGKPPWSQQYQEVAALFHVGTTKSHPPIPEHLSSKAKDFLLKCLQEEPNLRPTASELLQHPFVSGEYQDKHSEASTSMIQTTKSHTSSNPMNRASSTNRDSRNGDHGSETCSVSLTEKLVRTRSMWESTTSDDMCRIDDDKDDFPVVGSSFNPMSEPFDDWSCKFDMSPEQPMDLDKLGESVNGTIDNAGEVENDFTFPCDAICEHDDEVTETKIRAFLDEKALDLKKLQTPLYEEFLNTSNASNDSPGLEKICRESVVHNAKLPPKSKPSPSKIVSGTQAALNVENSNKKLSPRRSSRRFSFAEVDNNSHILKEIQSPRHNEWGEPLLETQQEPYNSPSASDRHRKWKEELDRELEMMRQAGVVGKASSPKDSRGLSRKRDRWRLMSPGK